MLRMCRIWLAVALGFGLIGCAEPGNHVLATSPDAAGRAMPRVSDRAGFPDSVTIGLAESRGYLFAPVRINDQDAGLFMVDTGANLTVIETGTANRLGLPVGRSGRTLGVAGSEAFQWRSLEHITLGDQVALSASRAAALSLYGITGNLNVGVNGILGYRSFGSLPFTIDPADHKLTLHRPDAYRPDPAASRAKLVRDRGKFRGLPVIEATVGDPRKNHRLYLILDTGAHNDLTLPDELTLRWPDILPVDQHGHGRTVGIGGTLVSRQSWVGRVDVLGVTLRNVQTNFEPPPGSSPAPGDKPGSSPASMRTSGGGGGGVPVGRIGNGLLRHFKLSFDPKQGVVDAVFLPAVSE